MKPFTDVLREVRAGLAVEELTEQLTQLVQAVRSTNKAGTLTLIDAAFKEMWTEIEAALAMKILLGSPE